MDAPNLASVSVIGGEISMLDLVRDHAHAAPAAASRRSLRLRPEHRLLRDAAERLRAGYPWERPARSLEAMRERLRDVGLADDGPTATHVGDVFVVACVFCAVGLSGPLLLQGRSSGGQPPKPVDAWVTTFRASAFATCCSGDTVYWGRVTCFRASAFATCCSGDTVYWGRVTCFRASAFATCCSGDTGLRS
jgi:hypothetical protein